MNSTAKEAYDSYVRTYESYNLKHIFNAETLDLKKVAKSFGFNEPPNTSESFILI